MATLPTTTFYWRPSGGAADAWTEDADGSITPTAGQTIEVVSVGPSKPAFRAADTTPSVTLTAISASYDTGVTVNPTYGGTNRTYSLSGPDWLSINASTGQVTGTTPGTDFTGSYTVTVSNAAGSASDTEAVTVAAVSLTPVAEPVGLGWDAPITVLSDGAGNYSTDYDAADWIVSGVGATYYLSPTGDDGNDGLSVGAPKLSLSALITALNASPPSGGATINAASGDYFETSAIPDLTFAANIRCTSGKARFIFAETGITWTKTGGRTNLYSSSTLTGTIARAVVDRTWLGADGEYRRLLAVAGGGAESDTTPGSLVVGASSIAVHTWDSRVADSDVLILRNDVSFWAQTSAVDIFIEGIELYGGAGVDHTAGTGYLAMDNCGIYAAHPDNCFEAGELGAGTKTIIFRQTHIKYANEDGANYDNNVFVFEDGCHITDNGWGLSPSNNNNSTAHDDCTVIRVNGDYRRAQSRCIHDITRAKSWNVACTAGETIVADATPFNDFAFGAGATDTDDALMWLLDCVCSGGVQSAVVARGDGTTVEIDGGTGLTPTTELGGGTVTVI